MNLAACSVIQVYTATSVAAAEAGAMATWSEGDWDGSLLFDTSDMVYAFVGGGYELGPRTAAAGVPEPSSLLLFVFGLTIATLVRLSPVSASLEN